MDAQRVVEPGPLMVKFVHDSYIVGTITILYPPLTQWLANIALAIDSNRFLL